jgi:hypothetical protein
VREAEFGLVVLLDDLKDNVGAFPLSAVFDKANLAVQDMPYDLPARYEFSDLLSATVKVFMAELELSTKLVGAALNVFRPPPTHIVDGIEDLLGRLVHRKNNVVIFAIHFALLGVSSRDSDLQIRISSVKPSGRPELIGARHFIAIFGIARQWGRLAAAAPQRQGGEMAAQGARPHSTRDDRVAAPSRRLNSISSRLLAVDTPLRGASHDYGEAALSRIDRTDFGRRASSVAQAAHGVP